MKAVCIDMIIADMTIEEKFGQMTLLCPMYFGVDKSEDLTGPYNDINFDPRHIHNVGGTLNFSGAEEMRSLQDFYLAHNRHKIPLIFMADVIHGYKTVFPIPLALGCSFNPNNYSITTRTAASESSASGIQLTFSPMSDLVRDPRWGRVMESPGEDPFLNSLMVAAAVKGFQGDDPKSQGSIASCVKHFAGYGASEGGRDYNWVDMSENTFRQYYLPAYKAAIQAGCRMVMTSFNVIDGVPSSANRKLFRGILREEWGFDGVTISDYAAINETIINGLAQDGSEATRMCIEAGVDIEMMSTHYINHGKKLVDEGKLSITLIDQAVRNILNLKNELGLFENPYKDASKENETKLHLCDEHRARARSVAHECAVLLKNESVLPLTANSRVGIAGPFAVADWTGGSWAIASDKNNSTLAASIQSRGISIVTAMDKGLGSMQTGVFDCENEVADAVEKLKDCDVLIAAVGENPRDTGEAASKTNLRLTPNQEELIVELKKLNKPLVMIVFSGRPLEIEPMLSHCDAVLQAWFLGTESSSALTDILYGDYNPSGRLSMSFPHCVGQIPIYYNGYNTGRPNKNTGDRYVSRYLDCPNEPLFPFGYGLSYSEVEYSNFTVRVVGDTIQACIKVTNKSDLNAKETVQLYVRDLYASIVRPAKELKGFKQVDLVPCQAQTVEFEITKDMLRFYNDKLEFVFEGGEFDVMIGKNSRNVSTATVFFY